jgi:1,6-anhydro-N-acetylmuramate kinase
VSVGVFGILLRSGLLGARAVVLLNKADLAEELAQLLVACLVCVCGGATLNQQLLAPLAGALTISVVAHVIQIGRMFILLPVHL